MPPPPEFCLTTNPRPNEGLSVIAIPLRARWRIYLALALATLAPQPGWAQSSADKQQAVEMAFDQYTAAKTEDERVAIVDYLQHFDRTVVATALVDHIIASHNGIEATSYGQLVGALGAEGCAAIVDRLKTSKDAVPKGKLIVALRRCHGDEGIRGLTACLDDKRVVTFEAHGAHPRRVCDLAYDELFLKLRGDPRYGLDPSPHMRGVITEKIPDKARDALIAKLKAKLASIPLAAPSASPAPSAPPVPSPSASPVPAKPAMTGTSS